MEKLAIIGSGTMGHTIALNAALSDIPVRMYGHSDDDLAKGLSAIKGKLDILESYSMVHEGTRQRIFEKISGSIMLSEAIEGATFIIECAPENLELKKRLFQDLDRICDPNVVLASNTSGLRLSEISEGTQYPERILVTHFWNPAHLIPLVEVLKSELTSVSVVSRTMALLNRMGKKPIMVQKEVPGLVGNRLQFALFREAQHLLEEGIASKEDIDDAVKYSIGRRLSVTGPFASADMGGLDVFSSICDYLFSDLSNRTDSFGQLKNLVNRGKLGCKSGEGYYNWAEKSTEKLVNQREQELIRHIKRDKEQG